MHRDGFGIPCVTGSRALMDMSQVILGTGRVFFDRTGLAGLAFSTGPDRPVGTLNLTGKKPAENRPVQLRNITGEKPVRSI